MDAYQRSVASQPTVHFLEALTTNQATADVDLQLPSRDALWFIRAIAIVAVQNLSYEIQVYRSASNLGGTFPTDQFLAVWQFPAMTAGPPATAGYTVTPVGGSADPFYHYYVDGNMVPYYDADQLSASAVTGIGNSKLHCRLVNRSAGSKNAGATGAVLVTFYVSPQGRQVS